MMGGVSKDFWRGRRVFLTGHTGFKGAWLAFWLKHMGASVHGYALKPPTTPNLYEVLGLQQEVTSHYVDIDALGDLVSALYASKAEIVLHLAAQALVRTSYREPVETFRTNVMGTAHILEAVRRVGGVAATVIVTTDKCYENREQIWSYREGDALGGRDPYSGSKAAAEIVTSSMARSFFGVGSGLGAVATARAGNVLGGGDWSEDRLIPDLIRALVEGRAAQIRRPDSVRPWQHVLEPLSGYLMLAERLATAPETPFDSWNFGPDHDAERDVLHVARRLCDIWGRPQALEVRPDGGPHEAGLLTLDNTKARLQLGWRPKLPLEETLQWVVGWHRAEQAAADMRAATAKQIEDYIAL